MSSADINWLVLFWRGEHGRDSTLWSSLTRLTPSRGELQSRLDEVGLQAGAQALGRHGERRFGVDRREAVGVGVLEESVGGALVGRRDVLDRLVE
ncbi:MAG: hypothetical protein JOZ61_03615 [Verrucomicrobia bacterium]|nr:hypothetical protein [Verrucomicrobiota bacterium]